MIDAKREVELIDDLIIEMNRCGVKDRNDLLKFKIDFGHLIEDAFKELMEDKKNAD